MGDEQDVRGAMVAERRSQVELYGSLTDAQWRAPPRATSTTTRAS